jgi:hypothetical protein
MSDARDRYAWVAYPCSADGIASPGDAESGLVPVSEISEPKIRLLIAAVSAPTGHISIELLLAPGMFSRRVIARVIDATAVTPGSWNVLCECLGKFPAVELKIFREQK